MRNLTALAGRINGVGVWLGGIAVLVMGVLITVEVIVRRLFNSSTYISDEVSGYLLVLVTFLGLGYTLREGSHIQVRMAVDRLSPRGIAWLRLGWCILGLAYAGLLAEKAWELVVDSYQMNAVAVSVVRTPQVWPQAPIVIGLVLLMLQLVVEAVDAGRTLMTKES